MKSSFTWPMAENPDELVAVDVQLTAHIETA